MSRAQLELQMDLDASLRQHQAGLNENIEKSDSEDGNRQKKPKTNSECQIVNISQADAQLLFRK